MKKLGLLIVFLEFLLILLAKPVKQDDICTAGLNWINAYSSVRHSIKEIDIIKDQNEKILIVKIDFLPSGFIVMTADDDLYPLLAYSLDQNIINNKNPQQMTLLSDYITQINYFSENKSINQLAQKYWKQIINDQINPSKSTKLIEMEIDWNQSGSYNSICPLVNGTRCLVGCGATAFAQIINFHKGYDYNFSGSDEYLSSHSDEPISIQFDYDAQSFNFPNFTTLNTYMTQVKNTFNSGYPYLSTTQQAYLSFASGILLKSKFGLNSTSTNLNNLQPALSKLGYTSQYQSRSSGNSSWHQLLQHDILQNKPVVYSGYAVENPLSVGHFFIIKGFNNDQANPLYCVNWGWGSGYANQWWTLDALGPQNNQFNFSQSMFYNIKSVSQVNFTINLNDAAYDGNAVIELINKNTLSKQTYYAVTSPYSIPNLEAHTPYDINIFHNSGNYEWVQKENYTFSSGTNSMTILLKSNPDKIINVPEDYNNLSAAISAIQNGGSIYVNEGNYSASGWNYKHIRIIGRSSYVYLNELILNGKQYSNEDVLENLKFNNLNIIGHLKLLNGAAPTIKNCHFNDHTVYTDAILPVNQNKYMGLGVFIEGTADQTQAPVFVDCLFKNNIFYGGNGGAAVGLAGGALFRNCTFTYNAILSTVNGNHNGFLGGGAVYVYNLLSPQTISFDNCSFSFNKAENFSKDLFIVRADPTSNITIQNCSFTGNEDDPLMNKTAVQIFKETYTSNDDPLYYSTADIIIKNNQFKNLKAVALKYVEKYQANNFKLLHNLFYKMEANIGSVNAVEISSLGSSSDIPGLIEKETVIINNTFKIIDGYAIHAQNSYLTKIVNNMFENCVLNAFNLINTNPQIDYNYFYSSGDHNTAHNIVGTTTSLNTFTFMPVWSAQSKSVCIDSGMPDLDGDGQDWITDSEDRDPDGTRKDIGANFVPHGTMIHEFSQNPDYNKIYWISFPYLDKLFTNTSLFDADQLYYILNDFESNHLLDTNGLPFVDSLLWNYHNNTNQMYYSAPDWINSNETADSRIGYKLILKPGTETQTLLSSGFLCGLEGNPNKTMTIKTAQGSPFREQWLGYFNKKSEDPLVALSQIANDLIEIKTQNWSINRKDVTKSWNYPTRQPLINQGEMVSIKYTGNRNKDFIWTTSPDTIITDTYSEPFVNFYSFEQKPDYIPIFVVLDPAMKKLIKNNSELAFFINDQCFGAEVVYGDTVQINAYITDLPEDLSKIEFHYHNSEMGTADQIISEFAVYNFTREKYEMKPLNLLNGEQFYKVSLNSYDFYDHTLPPTSRITGNYPNPFNPSTKIKYSIVEDTHVTIGIYNIKGQLVKKLVDEEQMSDHYEIEWDGKNSNGHRVTSGIYFCKLNTGKVKQTRKMLLIK